MPVILIPGRWKHNSHEAFQAKVNYPQPREKERKKEEKERERERERERGKRERKERKEREGRKGKREKQRKKEEREREREREKPDLKIITVVQIKTYLLEWQNRSVISSLMEECFALFYKISI